MCLLEEEMTLATTRKDTRAIDRKELLDSEWTIIVGESIVAIGSVVVVFGLIRAFRMFLKENAE